MRRLWRVALAGASVLTLAVLLPLGTNVASAHALTTCANPDCIYWVEGVSGSNAQGTLVYINVPESGWQLHYSDDEIVENVWLFKSDSDSIESGIDVGADPYCGYKSYFFPYGTQDNGWPESADCSLSLSPGSDWVIDVFTYPNGNGDGYSNFLNTSLQSQWIHVWSDYAFNGTNEDFSENHAGGSTIPSFLGDENYISEQWFNGTVWSYWGYTNIVGEHLDGSYGSGSCPFLGTGVDSSEWYAYDDHC